MFMPNITINTMFFYIDFLIGSLLYTKNIAEIRGMPISKKVAVTNWQLEFGPSAILHSGLGFGT